MYQLLPPGARHDSQGKNSTKKAGKEEARKGIAWGDKDYEKFWHIPVNLEAHTPLCQNTVLKKTRKDPTFSHLADLKGLSKKKVKARGEL